MEHVRSRVARRRGGGALVALAGRRLAAGRGRTVEAAEAVAVLPAAVPAGCAGRFDVRALASRIETRR